MFMEQAEALDYHKKVQSEAHFLVHLRRIQKLFNFVYVCVRKSLVEETHQKSTRSI